MLWILLIHSIKYIQILTHFARYKIKISYYHLLLVFTLSCNFHPELFCATSNTTSRRQISHKLPSTVGITVAHYLLYKYLQWNVWHWDIKMYCGHRYSLKSTANMGSRSPTRQIHLVHFLKTHVFRLFSASLGLDKLKSSALSNHRRVVGSNEDTDIFRKIYATWMDSDSTWIRWW